MVFDPTSIFTALANFFSFTEKLSPAIIDWLEAQIPAERQRVMAQRIRRCKWTCRRQKLSRPLIAMQVRLLFSDLTLAQQSDIEALISFELGK